MRKMIAVLLFIAAVVGCGDKTGPISNATAERGIQDWAFAHANPGPIVTAAGNFKVSVNRIRMDGGGTIGEGEALFTNFWWRRPNSTQMESYSGPAAFRVERYNTGWVLKEIRLKIGTQEFGISADHQM